MTGLTRICGMQNGEHKNDDDDLSPKRLARDMLRKLTLAVPNRNGGRYLEDTLRSLDRNRPQVRWWLQDSCSTDDSIAISRRFASDEDHVIVEKDSGQTDALNRAFSKMGGDIVGFINSDDCLAEGAAEAVLETFEQNPDIDIVYGDVEWIDVEGRTTGYHSGNISNLAEVLDIYRVWWKRRQWVQPEVFWRRSLWDKVGAFDTNYDLAFDYDYWVRCFLNGANVKKIHRVLAKFRRHDAQKSTRAQQAADEIRDILHGALAQRPNLSWWQRFRLESCLEYDRYQSGQDYGHGQRPDFAATLARSPKWIMIPAVRQRLIESLAARLNPRSARD